MSSMASPAMQESAKNIEFARVFDARSTKGEGPVRFTGETKSVVSELAPRGTTIVMELRRQ